MVKFTADSLSIQGRAVDGQQDAQQHIDAVRHVYFIEADPGQPSICDDAGLRSHGVKNALHPGGVEIANPAYGRELFPCQRSRSRAQAGRAQ